VVEDIKSDQPDAVDELCGIIQKLMK